MKFRGVFFFFAFVFFCPSPARPAASALSDDQLLELVQKQSYEFFARETNRRTGLVADRASNLSQAVVSAPASIAATGFGLSALAVAEARGWVDGGYARALVRATLIFFLESAPQEHGFFYHFLNRETGERSKKSELSPIDTALFLAGALFAADYFDDPDLRAMALKIYERVDFPWMLNGGRYFALAWSPEQGFSKYRWDHLDESLLLYILALGSSSHPIDAEGWKTLRRPAGSYRDMRMIQMPPLFTHQYPHLWIDFRNKNDGFADYFQNSVKASQIHRAFCFDQAKNFSTYGRDAWGISASDGPYGYKAYGAPPGWAQHDGTLAPTACGSSIMFTPAESTACLRHYYEKYKDRLWGRYGFSDAFNLDQDWFDDQVIGIDQGALILAIENARSGLLWKTMASNPFLTDGLSKAGFKPGTMDLPWPAPPIYRASYLSGGITIDGFLRDWSGSLPILRLGKAELESGSLGDKEDFGGEVRMVWDEKALYFSVRVRDQDLVARRVGQHIWMDDIFELYLDPTGDGLRWKNADDFQLGFSPDATGNVRVWSWFQRGEDPTETRQVFARGGVYPGGYFIEGAIRWEFLGIRPRAGAEIRLSAGIHDVDRDRSEAKVQWFMRSAIEGQRFELGRVRLDG